MSVLALSWVYDALLGLPKGPADVLLALANCADDDGTCWPSQEYLASRTRYTTRTISTHVRFLEDAGLLARSARYVSRSGGARMSDLYRLNVGAGYDPTGARSSIEPLHLTVESIILAPWAPGSGETGPDVSPSQAIPENASGIDPAARPAGTDPDVSPSQAIPEDVSGIGSIPETGDFNTGNWRHPIKEEPSIEPPACRPARARTREAGLAGGPDGSAGELDLDTEVEADHELVRACLPAAMWSGLDARGLAFVSSALEPVLARGWRPSAIRKVMEGQALPDGVRSMSRLVAYRLGELPGRPVGGRPASGETDGRDELWRASRREPLSAWRVAFREARLAGDPSATYDNMLAWRAAWEAGQLRSEPGMASASSDSRPAAVSAGDAGFAGGSGRFERGHPVWDGANPDLTPSGVVEPRAWGKGTQG